MSQDIFDSVERKYCLLWMHKKTGELAITGKPYWLHHKGKRTLEMDVAREGKNHYAKLIRFQKTWEYVCERY